MPVKRRKELDKGLFLLALIVVIIAASTVFLVLQLRSDEIAEDVKAGRLVNMLFLTTEDNQLLFTEMFLYHPTTGKGALFDIPGEWGDVIASMEKMDRIDVLFDVSDPLSFVRKIEELLDIKIPYYLMSEISNIERLVDLLDGLEMFIANPVEISTEEGIILLPSGSLLLDGSKVRTLISYVDERESEIELRGRHQKFVQSLLKRIGERSRYLQNEQVFDFFRSEITTNLDKRALLSFVDTMQELNAEYIISKPVHGDRVAVDDQVLLFPFFKGNLIRESVRQTMESLANTDLVSEDELLVALEVLNGTERTGLAGRTAQLFENFGYEVARVDNAQNNEVEFTQIISRSGDIVPAQKIANLIRCNKVELSIDTNQDIGAGVYSGTIDVTIIIGKDFDGRYCKE